MENYQQEARARIVENDKKAVPRSSSIHITYVYQLAIRRWSERSIKEGEKISSEKNIARLIKHLFIYSISNCGAVAHGWSKLTWWFMHVSGSSGEHVRIPINNVRCENVNLLQESLNPSITPTQINQESEWVSERERETKNCLSPLISSKR